MKKIYENCVVQNKKNNLRKKQQSIAAKIKTKSLQHKPLNN